MNVAQQIQDLPPFQLKSLTPDQIQRMFPHLDLDQIRALTPAQLKAVLPRLSEVQFLLLRQEQIQAVAHDLTLEQIRQLSPEQRCLVPKAKIEAVWSCLTGKERMAMTLYSNRSVRERQAPKPHSQINSNARLSHPVKQDSFGRLSLTELYAKAQHLGFTAGKSPPPTWCRNAGRAWIAYVAAQLKIPKTDTTQTILGRHARTFAHVQIALAYAHYLSPKLLIQPEVTE